jgi:hypothetical protein
VRIHVEDVVHGVGEAKRRLLASELRATSRKGAPFDAMGAANKIRDAGVEPVEFNASEAFAVLRALDNLHNGGRLEGARVLPQLREALIAQLGAPAVAYELVLLREWRSESRFISHSGSFDVGDRLLTAEGAWTVREGEHRAGKPDLLTCTVFSAERSARLVVWVAVEGAPRTIGAVGDRLVVLPLITGDAR